MHCSDWSVSLSADYLLFFFTFQNWWLKTNYCGGSRLIQIVGSHMRAAFLPGGGEGERGVRSSPALPAVYHPPRNPHQCIWWDPFSDHHTRPCHQNYGKVLFSIEYTLNTVAFFHLSVTCFYIFRGCKSILSHVQFQVSLTNHCQVKTSNLVITLELKLVFVTTATTTSGVKLFNQPTFVRLNIKGTQCTKTIETITPESHVCKFQNIDYSDNPWSGGETAGIPRQQCENASGDPRWNSDPYACIYMVVDSRWLH